jgi:hypothetical protein
MVPLLRRGGAPLAALAPRAPAPVASSQTASPTAADGGAGSWVNPTNVSASDDAYAQASTAGRYFEGSVRLVVGGVAAGDDRATGAALPLSDAYLTFGGSADLWGLALTPADVNAADFGLAFEGKDVTLTFSTGALKATGFGFSVPGTATITGVVARIEAKQFTSGKSTVAQVDHVELTVHYAA